MVTINVNGEEREVQIDKSKIRHRHRKELMSSVKSAQKENDGEKYVKFTEDILAEVTNIGDLNKISLTEIDKVMAEVVKILSPNSDFTTDSPNSPEQTQNTSK